MTADKPWIVEKVDRVMRLDPLGHAHAMLAITYRFPKRGYQHTIERYETQADPPDIQAAIQEDYDRLEALYAL